MMELNICEQNKIYSQHGQDIFVVSYFGNKRNGVFVDIGANDGITNSNTYYLEKELGWRGICIEPLPLTFEKLNKNRNCIKIMAAISDKQGVEKFTVVESLMYQLCGITKEYDERHIKSIKDLAEKSNHKISEIEVPSLLLSDILEKYNIFNIDYLNIDTEGNEFKILQTINFNKFHIRLITIENNYNDENQRNFVISKNYEFIGKLGSDDIFSLK